MEAKAQARHLRVTPMKARRVVDLIRGRHATDALTVLQFAPQAASEPVYKVVASAVANARVLAERDSQYFDERELVISQAYVDEGPTLKRFQPRAQGRAFRIRKRTCHVTVVVGMPDDAAPSSKSRGAKAKEAVSGKAAAPKKAAAKSTAKKTTATKSATKKPAATGDKAKAKKGSAS